MLRADFIGVLENGWGSEFVALPLFAAQLEVLR